MGLILNELLSNSLKHGFPNGRGGKVTVNLQRSESGQLMLVVADDGVGLPANVNLWNVRSLGLRLVRILSEQIGAQLNISSENGTRTEVKFKAQGEAR
jgi:two-component sensor histidine kinase